MSSDDLPKVTEQVSGENLSLLILVEQDVLDIARKLCSLSDHREDRSQIFVAEMFSERAPLTCRGLTEPSTLPNPMRVAHQ